MKKAILPILLLIFVSLYSEVQTAFDIGTGKIKMQVADIDVNTQTVSPLFSKAYRIEKHTFEHIKSLLESLLKEAKAYNSKVLIGIATEKYRNQGHEMALIELLSEATGIQIEIISAEKEGVLAHKTVCYENSQNSQDIIVWDIGSGSFQFSYYEMGTFFTYTSPYGRNPFYERYLLLSGTEEEKFQKCLENGLPFLEPPPEILLEKIKRNKGKIVCIGAYPFKESLSKLESGYLFVKLVKDALNITSIDYRRVEAGNTTGVLLEYNGFSYN